MRKKPYVPLAALMLTLSVAPVFAVEQADSDVDDTSVVPVSSTVVPLVTPVNHPALNALHNASPVEPGRHGGAELAGALLLCGLLLRAAYRRGII